jgi:hypothetical protein
MKIIQSNQIFSFGGLNFVLEEFDKKGIDKVFNNYLPVLPCQSKYNWKDLTFILSPQLFHLIRHCEQSEAICQ